MVIRDGKRGREVKGLAGGDAERDGQRERRTKVSQGIGGMVGQGSEAFGQRWRRK